ncbi:MAG: hypothetical protein ACYDHM_06035 [Acidiferrobacterales bacterium]
MARSILVNLGRALLIGASAGLVLIVAVRRAREHEPLTCVAGSARARAAALVPVTLADRYLDARHILFGLGDGAVGGWASLGDAVVAGGHIWLRTTNSASPDYYRLVVDRYFQTSFLAYVPAGTPPRTTLIIPPGEHVYRFWQQLGRRYPQGVMVEGYVKMKTLYTIAIARPPFSGLPVATDTPFYYTQPMQSASSVWVYLTGIVAHLSSAHWQDNTRILRRLVPHGQMRGSDGLADVLQLRTRPVMTDLPPAADTVLTVGQLVGRSTVSRGRLRIYPIFRATDCPDAYVQRSGS